MNELIVFIAKYLIGIMVLGAVWIAFTLSKERRLALLSELIIAGVVAGLLSKGLAHFYYDPRPFVSQNMPPLFPHAADNGFPSDHTTLSMLVALAIFPYARSLGVGLIIVSLLIGLARVLSLIHSPLDIAGSIVIAAVSVLLARELGKFIFSNRKQF